ncbi:restriction endonuclease subunit S [Candidatus Nitrotoga fabula]|uniref:restriction endonuclease subunit S n=1 Tax=Candidatus Nitrotoga fabula TaxID=2182327 RepID=UPI001BB47F12|nr:restriction endonuclease subunit S [Candidatus Nitrotoga fabula]
MKYVAYQKYKPAKAAWLNVLPEIWGQIRGRFVMMVNPPSRQVRQLDGVNEVSFVPMDAIGEYGGMNLERTRLLEEISAGYTAFEDGDVVVAKITPCFENGKGALAQNLKNGVGFGTTELHVLRTGNRLDKHFLFYLTISHTFRMLGEFEMYGAGGQKRVPPEFAKDFLIPLPPIDEQQTIARFLDAKTAQIDELIAKKRQLIDKLKEKRSALIARTVTRGLPPEAAKAAGLEPNPEIKNSGHPWLQVRENGRGRPIYPEEKRCEGSGQIQGIASAQHRAEDGSDGRTFPRTCAAPARWAWKGNGGHGQPNSGGALQAGIRALHSGAGVRRHPFSGGLQRNR